MKYIFEMAEVKEEGAKLWPQTYLALNGRLPKRSYYSKEEYQQIVEAGYSGEWFNDEASDNS